MGVTEITLPRLGETMEEARVTEWLVAPGENFARGDVLMEVETDKTVVEVPALMAGRMLEHLAEVGAEVGIGQPIARVETDAAGSVTSPRPSAQAAPVATAGAAPTHAFAGRGRTPASTARPDQHAPRVAASPVARRKARLAGIALDEIRGSGRRGRITAIDVEAAAAARTAAETGGRSRVRLGGGVMVYDRIAPALEPRRAPAVLLHGLFADATSWRELPQRIAAHGHEVILPDMPGHGDSAMELGNIDAFLSAARAFLDAVLPEGPVILMGHSLGAFAAAHLAAALGDRARRLIIFAPVGLGARMPRDFLDTMTEARSTAAVARGLRWLGQGAERLSQTALARELARAEAERPVRRMLVEAIAAGGVQQLALAETLAPMAVRTTAIFGLEDRLIDWRSATALPTEVAVHFVQGAGHLPQLNAADLVMRLLE